MPERSSYLYTWGMTILFAVFFLHWNAKATGSEIKLPPLRVQVGEQSPDFVLPSPSGNMVRLSQFKGHKVLIDFYRGYW